MSQRIPVVLVSGFLGAGKTTMMRHLIRGATAHGFKVAVIVNEFGVADVDGKLLRETEAELLDSVAGGCACCTGQEEFMLTLMDIAERRENRPDVLLIEASGLADPVLMLDCLTIASLLPHVRLASLISVVDTARFIQTRDEAVPLLLRQLVLCDHIVLNKIDIAFRPRDRDARLDEIEEVVRAANGRAQIHRARGGEIVLDDIWRACESEGVRSNSTVLEAGEEAPHTHFNTVELRAKTFSRPELAACLEALGPEVWRCKGFVQIEDEGLQLLQFTGGARHDWELISFAEVFASQGAPEPRAVLVFIGPSLDRAALMERFSASQLLAVMS